jgi:hypothetical protein
MHREKSEQKSTCLESNIAKTLTDITVRAKFCKLGDHSEQTTCLESSRAKTLTDRTSRTKLCKLGDQSVHICKYSCNRNSCNNFRL